MPNNITVLDSLGATQTLSTILTAGVHVPQSQNISETTIAAAAPTTAIMVGGSDGTNLRALSTDTGGQLKVLVENTPLSVTQSSGPWTINLTQVNSGNLGSPSNYGTSPGAVAVLGVNAFVTNTVAVVGPTSNTANTPTLISVTASSSQALAANSSRKECTIINTGTTVVFLGLGAAPSITTYHIPLSPCTSANDGSGGSYTSDIFKGAINVISGSTGSVVVTELT